MVFCPFTQRCFYLLFFYKSIIMLLDYWCAQISGFAARGPSDDISENERAITDPANAVNIVPDGK